MELQNTNTAEIRVGSASNARMGIGANPVLGFHLTVGGTSQFGWVRINQNLTVVGNYWVNTAGRIFERADAFNSLNLVSTNQINFSLQSNRSADPTTGTTALQLDDTNGTTINRAVVNNQTVNSIGNIVGEANVIAWGKFALQNAGEIREVLDTQYKMYVRNGDQAGELNLVMGLESSVPEIKLTDAKVNLLGHLDITHSTVTTSERVNMDNNDADGLIFLSINGANICEISSAGLHVNGTATETSDGRLKENLSEINSKICYDIVKYIKPKEFIFIGKEEREIGFIAQDILHSKMPKHWSKIVMKDSDDYLRMSYVKMNVVLWSAVQEMQNQIIHLKGEITKLKKT